MGDFLLVGEIAAGSSSTVYEALYLPGARPVALKVLARVLALKSEAVLRFRSEAALAERVRHPALVTIHGSGTARGHHFYAMELLSGLSLEEEVSARGPARTDRTFREAARSLASMAEAVGLLHEAGVVHRDIRPANVFLDREGRYVLGDFGLACDRSAPSDHASGYAAAALAYVAPEQLLPGADPCDPSQDIYALGATLYEILAGVPPFHDSCEEELVRRKLTEEPPNPRTLNPSVPMGLDAIVREAMAVPARERFPSAQAFAQELRRFAERGPTARFAG